MAKEIKRSASRRYVKWSVSLPSQIAQTAVSKVAAGEAPSISALVTKALEHELASGDDELTDLFRDWIASGELVVTEEDQEWARQVLAGSSSTPGRSFS
jgi:hypothetical protein